MAVPPDVLRAGTPVPAGWTEGPDVPVPDVTLPRLLRDAASRRPDAVAVRQWDTTLTYRELLERSAALARSLRRRGVRPGDRVGVCADRRPATVVALLGVLEAGAAYLPLETGQPPTRIREICADAGVRLAVVDDAGADLLAGSGVTTVPVPERGGDAQPLRSERGGDAEPVGSCPAHPGDPAYVLYTSGSTGRPKGVAVSHRAVVSYAVAFGGYAGAGPDTRSMGYTSFGFDVSILDIFVPLAHGGQVALVPAADRSDPARLQRFAEEHRVNWGFLPASLLPLLDPARLPAWRLLILGAEAPGPEQIERWAGPATAPVRRVLHCYGPTEATVCATAFEATGRWDGPVPIGVPLPNQRVYVVDENLTQVPVGATGEVLIGGAGLALGYLNRPAHTAERFVPDPFGPPGGRLYRTGDLARWLPDGTLMFLGRADRQVKVRGQRIELGEVEAALAGHPAVSRAVADTRTGPDGLVLVAYVTAVTIPPDGAVDAEDLRRHCADRLPAAMVPSRVTVVPAMPLTNSGKVDLTALHAAHDTASGATHGIAHGATHGVPQDAGGAASIEDGGFGALGEIWRRAVPGAAGAAAGEDFFALGGHSLTAMRLVAAVRQELRRDVAVVDVFEARTLGGLAERVAAAGPAAATEPTGGHPPALTAGQRRLWFTDQLAPESSAYNVSVVQRLTGPLDTDRLRAALRMVLARQQVLRWRIPQRDGLPYAELGLGPGPELGHEPDPRLAPESGPTVTPKPGVESSPGDGQRPGDVLPVDDLSALPAVDREAVVAQRLAAEAGGRFDLTTGPLWRARLLRLESTVDGGGEHLLVFSAHHAVFDGWSTDVLFRELAAAYRGEVAGPPAIGYADYVAWWADRDRRQSGGDLAWWVDHLSGAPTVLDLPRDRPRPAEQTYRAGELVTGALDEAADAAVRALGRRLGATPATVALAAFGELVWRLTGRTDVVVGTPAADRRHPAFADLIGFFVDIVPVRLRPGGGDFAGAVTAARDELLAVVSHPAAPLERLVDALRPPRDPGRAPLVQVLFNVFNFAEPVLALDGLGCAAVPAPVPGSPFDLTVYLVERGGRLCVDLLYNADLYDAARIRALLDGYLALLAGRAAAPGEPADRLAVELPAGGLGGTAGAVAGAAVPAPRPGAVLPATPTEELVAAVWRSVLGTPVVGVTDNFFDVGGTSMAVVEVRAALLARLGRDVRVVDLFRYPSIRALGRLFDGVEERPGGTGGGVLPRAAARVAARRGRVRRRTDGRTGGQPGGENAS